MKERLGKLLEELTERIVKDRAEHNRTARGLTVGWSIFSGFCLFSLRPLAHLGESKTFSSSFFSVADQWHFGKYPDPRIRGCLWIMDPDSDPTFFVIDLQDAKLLTGRDFSRLLDFTLSFAFTLVRAFHFFLRYLSKFPCDNWIFFLLSQALVWRVSATFPALVRCTLTIMKKYSGKRLEKRFFRSLQETCKKKN